VATGPGASGTPPGEGGSVCPVAAAAPSVDLAVLANRPLSAVHQSDEAESKYGTPTADIITLTKNNRLIITPTPKPPHAPADIPTSLSSVRALSRLRLPLKRRSSLPDARNPFRTSKRHNRHPRAL
jgi:hypothetical protein